MRHRECVRQQRRRWPRAYPCEFSLGADDYDPILRHSNPASLVHLFQVEGHLEQKEMRLFNTFISKAAFAACIGGFSPTLPLCAVPGRQMREYDAVHGRSILIAFAIEPGFEEAKDALRYRGPRNRWNRNVIPFSGGALCYACKAHRSYPLELELRVCQSESLCRSSRDSSGRSEYCGLRDGGTACAATP